MRQKIASFCFYGIYSSSLYTRVCDIQCVNDLSYKLQSLSNQPYFIQKSLDHNPFVPPAKEQKLVLEAIMNNKALLNGRWYKPKDKINGFEILKITKDSILLERNGYKQYIRIKK
ncbi:MAG: hypothetical protein MR629_05660 [Helicobacter sp.]|uniref:hypothetical protein n=1 Tax=Helicobacter sp. 10-6591 TaxID=2004998 RepID=UPI000DCBB17B|nr:hypothetical protein [Helicobacter sp. 10-6591]MCI6217996.1 hypothetical protein [Helicobacter sp.]MCI7485738.1 hypothetical protein [Helicobacter sp.]MDD7567324.1 hypothetical protein [Helicobacter sp.]MDY5740551.1 hypothetical protein [Helicobacter sp.]RAX55070.1 hypothetical protein CCY97_04660 [Helicobacter sp. 10-6591]